MTPFTIRRDRFHSATTLAAAWLAVTSALAAPSLAPEGGSAQDAAAPLPAERAPGTQAAATNQLDVFDSGPGRGLHALYRHENFVAKVRADATVVIQCLDGGANVGKPIHLRTFHHYQPAGGGGPVGRRIVAFAGRPAPALQPERLVFEAALEDGARLGLGIEFKANTVQTWGWLEDPKGLTPPTQYFRYLVFAPSHEFDPDVSVEAQKEILRPFTVRVEPLEGKPADHPFGERARGFATPASRIAIGGDVFGGRRVSVALGSAKETELQPWIYKDFAPYQGFQVRMRKRDDRLRDEAARMILTID